MPTYSYRCTACDNAFDVKQSFSDAALTECPVCGGVLRKVFSPVGVTFNGAVDALVRWLVVGWLVVR